MKKYNRKKESPFELKWEDVVPVYGFFSYRNRTKEFNPLTEEDKSNRRLNKIYQGAMFAVLGTGLLKIIL